LPVIVPPVVPSLVRVLENHKQHRNMLGHQSRESQNVDCCESIRL